MKYQSFDFYLPLKFTNLSKHEDNCTRDSEEERVWIKKRQFTFCKMICGNCLDLYYTFVTRYLVVKLEKIIFLLLAVLKGTHFLIYDL